MRYHTGTIVLYWDCKKGRECLGKVGYGDEWFGPDHEICILTEYGQELVILLDWVRRAATEEEIFRWQVITAL